MSHKTPYRDVLERWAERPSNQSWQWIPLCCLLRATLENRSRCQPRLQSDSAPRSLPLPSSLHFDAPIRIANCSGSGDRCGIPGSRFDGRLAEHLVFFRRWPLDQRPRHLLASSRWGPAVRNGPCLPHALRTLLLRWEARDHCPALWTGKGMTLDPLVTALAGRWPVRIIRFTQRKTGNWVHWLRQLPDVESPPGSPLELHISPKRQSGTPATVDLDGLLFHVAQTIHLLFVRPNSRTEQLARHALKKLRPPNIQVMIPGPANSEEPRAWIQHRTRVQRLMDRGAIGWVVSPTPSLGTPSFGTPSVSLPAASGRWPICRLGEAPAGRFLFHHTRAIATSHPNESEADRWWRWLKASESPSPLQTLLRIAIDGRLRAHGLLIPGGQPMICFSRRSPRESVRARCFRSHLNRWDYEPYGLAIGRAILQERGARGVVYWDPEKEPAPDNIPPAFRQKRFSKVRQTRIDWSLEQEFRLPGDLDLKGIPTEGIRFFVPSYQEAVQLSLYSRWPVCYLND